MEIGALAILVIISLSILFVEKTSVGSKFTKWALRTFMDIDVNELED